MALECKREHVSPIVRVHAGSWCLSVFLCWPPLFWTTLQGHVLWHCIELVIHYCSLYVRLFVRVYVFHCILINALCFLKSVTPRHDVCGVVWFVEHAWLCFTSGAPLCDSACTLSWMGMKRARRTSLHCHGTRPSPQTHTHRLPGSEQDKPSWDRRLTPKLPRSSKARVVRPVLHLLTFSISKACQPSQKRKKKKHTEINKLKKIIFTSF